MKIRGDHKENLKTLKNQIVQLLGGYSLELEEELRTVKRCLEKKALPISKLDMEILDLLDDEVEIATEIIQRTSENIQTRFI